MNPLRSLHFRTAIAIAATLFFVSALVTGVLVYQRQQALEHKLRENLIWAVYQFDREVRELRMVVAEEQKMSGTTGKAEGILDPAYMRLNVGIGLAFAAAALVAYSILSWSTRRSRVCRSANKDTCWVPISSAATCSAS